MFYSASAPDILTVSVKIEHGLHMLLARLSVTISKSVGTGSSTWETLGTSVGDVRWPPTPTLKMLPLTEPFTQV